MDSTKKTCMQTGLSQGSIKSSISEKKDYFIFQTFKG